MEQGQYFNAFDALSRISLALRKLLSAGILLKHLFTCFGVTWDVGHINVRIYPGILGVNGVSAMMQGQGTGGIFSFIVYFLLVFLEPFNFHEKLFHHFYFLLVLCLLASVNANKISE